LKFEFVCSFNFIIASIIITTITIISSPTSSSSPPSPPSSHHHNHHQHQHHHHHHHLTTNIIIIASNITTFASKLQHFNIQSHVIIIITQSSSSPLPLPELFVSSAHATISYSLPNERISFTDIIRFILKANKKILHLVWIKLSRLSYYWHWRL